MAAINRQERAPAMRGLVFALPVGLLLWVLLWIIADAIF